MQMYANVPQQSRQRAANVHYQSRPAGQIPSMDFDFWLQAPPPSPSDTLSFKSQPTPLFDSTLLHSRTQDPPEERKINEFIQRTPLPVSADLRPKYEAMKSIESDEKQLFPPEEPPTLVPKTYTAQDRLYQTDRTSIHSREHEEAALAAAVELEPFSPDPVSSEELSIEENSPVEAQTLPESEITTRPSTFLLGQTRIESASDFEHLAGKQISVDIEPGETIGSLKALIFAKTGLPIPLQQLFFNRKELDDAFTLDIYRILPESILYVHFPNVSAANSQQTPAPERWTTQLFQSPASIVPDRIQISVKISTGRVISLSVDPKCTIGFLKKQIEDLSGLPKAQQLLLYANKRLIDYCSLADYEVCDGAWLHLSVRAAGGMTLFIGFCFNSLDSLSITRLTRVPATCISFMVLQPGLSFISKCKNTDCKAYRQSITVNKGFGLFDLARTSGHLTCPICENAAETATNCGFYKANWVFDGQLADETDIRREGKAETDHYYTYKEGDNLQWRYLQVTVSSLVPN